MKILLLFTALVSLEQVMGGWTSNNDKVLLSEVSSITLEKGRMTNGRRSSAVPQLSCVGGSAGCHAFQPSVVQCLNRGSDGYDAQWECKTDMGGEYRFGKIQVSCEGYDYPEDRYILKGSCGLDYEIDLTEEGRRGGNDHHGNSHTYNNYSSHSGGWGKFIQVIIAVVVLYFIFKCFCSGNRRMYAQSAGYNTDGTTTSGTGQGATGGGAWNGWTGLATGGLLGYLFGNRGTGRGYGGGYGGGSTWGASPRYGRSSGWGSGSSGWGSGSSGWGSGSRSSRSSGSRSTSGFGGTSRR